MKNVKYFLMVLLLVSIFCLHGNKASADDVEFAFYYQSIEEIVTINEPVEASDSWWDKLKKGAKKVWNGVKRTWEKVVTRNVAPGEGEKLWYSEKDKNQAYKVKRTKVTTEEELLKAIGKSESELSDGQKALLAVFRKSKSDAVKEEAKIGYIPKVNVILTDTTGFEYNPNISDDFWPCSTGLTISMNSNHYNYGGGSTDAESTFVHEFAHCLDATIKEFKNPYGLDGHHMGNEITNKRAAFVEAWAEYNEMIASEDEAKKILKRSEVLYEESKTIAASYTRYLEEDCTSDQLMRSEAHLAKLFYRLTKETNAGKDGVYKAFVDTRWNVLRDMRTLVKKFVKNNPDDTEAVCKIVDEVFLGKLTDKELLDFVGKNEKTKAYLEKRGKGTGEEEIEYEVISGSIEEQKVTASEEVIEVENSGNPFGDD